VKPHAVSKVQKAGIRSICALPAPTFPSLSFVTGGLDHKIVLWRLSNCNKPTAGQITTASIVNPHTSAINALDFCPINSRLLSGGADKRVTIFDLQPMRGSTRAVIKELGASVTHVHWRSVCPGTFSTSANCEQAPAS
jgi:WD40 repeat protein